MDNLTGQYLSTLSSNLHETRSQARLTLIEAQRAVDAAEAAYLDFERLREAVQPGYDSVELLIAKSSTD